jgi:hypothetical protein
VDKTEIEKLRENIYSFEKKASAFLTVMFEFLIIGGVDKFFDFH